MEITEDIRQPISKPRMRPRNSLIRSSRSDHSTVTHKLYSVICWQALSFDDSEASWGQNYVASVQSITFV